MKIDSANNVKAFETAIKKNQTTRLGKLICEGIGKKISLHKLQEIGERQPYFPLIHAIDFTLHMETIPGLSATEKQLLCTAYFIETKMQELLYKGKVYFPESKDVPCTIHCDSSTNTAYIILPGKKAKISECKHKANKLAIEYSRETSTLVLYSEAKKKMEKELENLQLTRSLPFIIQPKAILSPRKSAKKEETAIIYPYFNPGSLLKNAMATLQEGQKVSIASQMLKSLDSLHSRNLIHRNIAPESFFLQQTGPDLKVVLAHLRHVRSGDDMRKKAPNTNPLYNPPEALSDRSKIDPKKSEIFSLGCIFYELFHGVEVPWIKDHLLPSWVTKSGHLTQKKELKKTFKAKIKELRHLHLGHFNQQEENHTVIQKKMMMNILHSDPAKRPSLQAVIKAFA